MSRHVLASLSAALALFSALPAWSAEPAAPLFVVEQQRASMVARLAQQWGPAFDALRLRAPLPRVPRQHHLATTTQRSAIRRLARQRARRRRSHPCRRRAGRSCPVDTQLLVKALVCQRRPHQQPAVGFRSCTPAPAARTAHSQRTRTFNGFGGGFSPLRVGPPPTAPSPTASPPWRSTSMRSTPPTSASSRSGPPTPPSPRCPPSTTRSASPPSPPAVAAASPASPRAPAHRRHHHNREPQQHRYRQRRVTGLRAVSIGIEQHRYGAGRG